MTPASMRNKWKQGSWLLWSTVQPLRWLDVDIGKVTCHVPRFAVAACGVATKGVDHERSETGSYSVIFVFRNIIYAWVVTVPVAAGLSAAFMAAFRGLLLWTRTLSPSTLLYRESILYEIRAINRMYCRPVLGWGLLPKRHLSSLLGWDESFISWFCISKSFSTWNILQITSKKSHYTGKWKFFFF